VRKSDWHLYGRTSEATQFDQVTASSRDARSGGENKGERNANIPLVRRHRPRDGAVRDQGRDPKAGRSLALIPLCAAAILAALMLPRKVVPDTLPLPDLDDRVISREIRADEGRAAGARRSSLSSAVRALGSAIREFHTAEAEGARDVVLSDARAAVDQARLGILGKGKDEETRALRAVQMDGFLEEVRRFEHTGKESRELEALGGTFLRRMRTEGWCQGNVIVLTDLQRRALFKANWNQLVEVEKDPAFVLSDQETRAVYTLYFTHPHASDSQRASLERARAQAKDSATCARIDDGEHAATQAWLITKLTEYAKIDPAYPVAIARGVAFYQRHQYADAARSFSQWLEAHPDGPWTLRTRNYLRASAAAEEETF
jgi:hypothetical protein